MQKLMSKVGWFYGVETDGRTRPIAVTRSAILSSGLCTEKASGEDVERMLRDACMLRGVRHNNVKSVVGVCVEPRGPPPLLLYRFDNDCNLKIYLQLCRTAHVYALSVLAAYSSFNRHARHDTDRTVLSCLVWWCELSRPDRQAGAFCVCLCRSVSGGAVRPPDALRRRTHLSGGRADSIHIATPDTTRLPRPPVETQFTPPDTTQRGPSCRVWRAV